MSTRKIAAFALFVVVSTATLGGTFFSMLYPADAEETSSSQAYRWDDDKRSLTVTGISSIKVSPDRVTISFAVESQETTAQAAVRTNAETTNNVIAALQQTGLSESELSTSNYNIYPVYEYAEMPAECIQYGENDKSQEYCPPPATRQILVGYKAVNGIVVESAQLDRIGLWIDAAVEAGANRIDYLYFYVSSERQDQIRNNILTEAVQDARGKATNALRPLGMQITDVLSINIDSYPFIYPKRGYELAPGSPSSTSTPIIPGAQEVSATIHATFEIGGFAGSQIQANATIQTSVNEEFQVTLDSNPSTGYQWEVTSIDETMVKLVNNEYVAPDSDLVGASGQQVFTFEALKEGVTTTISLEYVRPWEPENPAGVYSVEVSISNSQ